MLLAGGFSISIWTVVCCLHSRVFKLKISQQTASGYVFILRWHNVEMFAVPLVKFAKYFVESSDLWRARKPPYKQYVFRAAVLWYFTCLIFDGDRVGRVTMRVAEIEFVLCALICSVRRAQLCILLVSISSRMHENSSLQWFLLPLFGKMWESLGELGVLHLLHGRVVAAFRPLLALHLSKK